MFPLEFSEITAKQLTQGRKFVLLENLCQFIKETVSIVIRTCQLSLYQQSYRRVFTIYDTDAKLKRLLRVLLLMGANPKSSNTAKVDVRCGRDC